MNQPDWKATCVRQDQTMAEAIRVLDAAGLRIVLVCDERDRLVGTITDGDIRRSLLKGMDQGVSVHEVMHRQPTTVHVDDDRDVILDLMQNKSLLHLPVVDDDGRLLGLETLSQLTRPPRFDNAVLLMAGGFGRRLQPLTDHTPKPLLRVGSKPILETIIEQFVHYGFSRFYISTHYKAEMLQAHFSDGSRWGIDIDYLHEHEPLGTAGSLGLLPEVSRQKPVIVMNGDLLTRVNFQMLLDYHENAGADATLCVREHSFTIPYGVVESTEHRLTRIVEKPRQRYLVNAGIYVMGPNLLSRIPAGSHTDMTDILQQGVDSGDHIATFPIHEYWLDIGRMEDYERANDELAKDC